MTIARAPVFGRDVPDAAWRPDPDLLADARLADLLRSTGSADLEALQARAVDDPAWFWSAAVDDLWQGVDLVIRGIDLLDSTGRQIQLARLLGRQVPATFMHHPLIMKTRSQKLSKSDGDTGVRALAGAGWTRDRILAEAARLPASQGRP